MISESLSWDGGEWGVFLPVLNQIRSNHDIDRQGLEFGYAVDTAMLQWGKRFGNWGAGLMYSYSDAVVTNDAELLRITDSHAHESRYRFGGLYTPVDKLLLGFVAEYGRAPYRTDTTAPTPLGLMQMSLDGNEEQYIVRPAVSFEYAELSSVFFDFEHGRYHTNRDELSDNRYSVGIEHRIFEWLFLRATASIDARGNTGLNTGMTGFFSRRASIDVGYQYNMLPELHPEFGYSNTIQAACSVRF